MRFPHLAPCLGVCLLAAPGALAQVFLQNDAFTGGVFTCQVGFDDGEAIGVRFTAAPSQYPYTIERVRILGCAGGLNGVSLDIYQDTGGVSPGPLLWHGSSYSYDGGNTFNDILMSNETTQPPFVASGSVRVVLTSFFITPPFGFANDANGINPGRNFIRLVNGTWFTSESLGVSGDWIVRLGINPNTTPVELQSFEID